MTSTGGRFHFRDDWEFPDTQAITFELAGDRAIVWSGESCKAGSLRGRPPAA